MVWPFTRTGQHSLSTRIHASKESIVKFLHNSEELFRLNPLLTSMTQDPDNPNKWDLEDDLIFMGFKIKSPYSVIFEFKEDGMIGDAIAGAGVRTRSIYKATAVEEGVCELTEDITVTANAFLMSYVISTQNKAHAKIFEKIKEKLETKKPDSPSTSG
ncbi:hypothetical protein M422DRAFT_35602 [Sphaerobolus stellatus SS14]|uniref:Unplaced genomic scaffold SPHSTscaffold_142, whole genome shotgun sequence n=1 Tax=Sphaerobolus stellatus (strain SS14) TaxID=990650 RepID=A0A0C9UUZ5_SPHS4|nr:hypothetical protein M422DRAFT_35602 [Sphaerobolus stellatus SS14]